MILTYRIRAAIGSAPQPQPTASFDDPRVQRVYKIL